MVGPQPKTNLLPRSVRWPARVPLLLCSLALFCLPVGASSQVRPAGGAVVTGRVVDARTGDPLAGAVASIEGTQIRTQTDEDGRYRLVDLPPGPQVLRVLMIGYAPVRVQFVVPASGTIERDVRLAVSALEMEGIVVTADAAGRARGELGTASVIDREAIKHLTATSLAGVLELIPGVPLQPPGLDGLQQIPLRSVPTSGTAASAGFGSLAGDLASFGTAIILDGVPVSNNANLQTVIGELGFTTSSGGGVDLRQIPASMLERVEVIRGIPSARYGDLTQGVVIVDTRAGNVDLEFKGQFDARTTATSLVGGRDLSGVHSVTSTFDFAGTSTQPGRADDRAYRVAGQFMHRTQAGRRTSAGSRVQLDTKLDFFQVFDDRPPNPNVGRTRGAQTRDRGFRLTERVRVRFNDQTRLAFTGALTAVRQRSFANASLVRTALPFTPRLTEGREEGFYVIGPYAAQVEVEGNPWLAYSRIEMAAERSMLGLAHELRGGTELRREWSSGPGRQFDVQFPPETRFNGVNGYSRPRRFDDIPALNTTAWYVDDRITTTFGRDALLQIQMGLRLDLLHDGSSWFSGARDAVLQPRLNVEFAPIPSLRLRGGWGRTAKTPALGFLFPAPQYHDVVNVNYFANDPVERLAVLTTFIRDPTNDDLGFARATKAEVGLEFGVAGAVVSLVAFRDRIDGGVGIHPEPTFLLREQFALTDSVLGNGIAPVIIEPATGADTVPILIRRPDNIITQTNRGFELTASLPEIPAIHTRLYVTGSWVETQQHSEALYFGAADAFSSFQLMGTDTRTPYWEGVTEVGERVLVTYRLIHHQPHAGLILTAIIQHNIHDELRDVAGTDTLAYLGYLTRDGQLVPVPEERRGDAEFVDLRLPRSGSLRERLAAPADWLLSVQVSKTLPLDGRLNFWAFNLLDRRGIRGGVLGVQSRIYTAVRVGLEVTLPVRALAVWNE